MKTRRGLLIGLGILASLSMTVPVAAANVEQTVISSVEGQQDSTVEENLPEGDEKLKEKMKQESQRKNRKNSGILVINLRDFNYM